MRSHTIRKVENHYKPPLRVFHISHLKKEKKKPKWVAMKEKRERGWNTTKNKQMNEPVTLISLIPSSIAIVSQPLNLIITVS